LVATNGSYRYRFYDVDGKKRLFAIAKEQNGMNTIRLRVFVNESKIKPVVAQCCRNGCYGFACSKAKMRADRFIIVILGQIPNKLNLLLGRTYRSMHYKIKSMNIHDVLTALKWQVLRLNGFRWGMKFQAECFG
jgi:hypothetical protein